MLKKHYAILPLCAGTEMKHLQVIAGKHQFAYCSLLILEWQSDGQLQNNDYKLYTHTRITAIILNIKRYDKKEAMHKKSRRKGGFLVDLKV